MNRDEELQTRAALSQSKTNGSSAAETAEVAAYRTVFVALGEEPEWALPPGFAERVSRRAFAASAPLWEWLAPFAVLLLAGVALAAVPAARTGVVVGLAPLAGALPGVPISLIAAVAGAIGVVLLADRLFFPDPPSPAY